MPWGIAPYGLPSAKAAMRWVLRAPVWLYRCKCGWLFGTRFLLLIHVGRRTRLTRYTVLEVMEYRAAVSEAVVMSAWGRRADWFRNIEAAQAADIIIGSRRFTAIHRILDTDEAASVIAGYETRNRLVAPMVRRVLSRFLGWRYDGTDEARRRVAAQLPLIAFRPMTPGRAG